MLTQKNCSDTETCACVYTVIVKVLLHKCFTCMCVMCTPVAYGEQKEMDPLELE